MTVPVTAIEGFIAEQMALGQMPGLGLTIIEGGETILERGYGYSDLARQELFTEHTPVSIGSTTKALTAAAVLQLVHRDLLSLDNPVRKHLPDFRLADHDAAERITVRHLLTHTAGLPPTPMDGPSFLYCDDMEPGASRRYLAGLASAEPVWAPGGGWLYANDGYVLAGRVIEMVSGMSYEEYMAANLFGPLGLEETRFPRRATPEPDVATAYDYGPDGAPYASFFPHNRAANAAGMVLSTAADAGRWLRTLLESGQVNGKRIIAPEAVAEMMRPQARIPAGPRTINTPEAWYGLGWMVSEVDGTKIVSHGGSTITMGSQFILIPEERLAVAVVANSGTETTGAIAEGVLRLMRGRDPVRSFPKVDRSFQPDRSRWPRLAGIYRPLEPQNAVTSLLPIEVTDSGLRARTYPGDDRRRPGDIHFAPLDEDLSFVLYGRGKTGGQAHFEIDGSTVRATLQGTPLQKVASRLHSGNVALWGP